MYTAPELLKMADFAARSGVPVPTIKHYLREGLLPEPVRTSRNMAYYDAALIPRVKVIKHLQREMFLPLRVIREVLDELGEDSSPSDLTVQASIRKVLARTRDAERRTRDALIAAGVPEALLDWYVEQGLLTPIERDGEVGFEGDDLAFLRLMKQARKAGLGPEMLPRETLPAYLAALQGLVRAELSMFRAAITPHTDDADQLAALAEAATELSERLVVLLRRKLLLPTLLELLANERKAANAEPPPASLSRDSSASPPLQAAPRAVASHPDELGVDAVDSPTVPHPRLSVADEGAIR
jgi:DNA-binding transcriptional MerR regulator